MAGDDDDILESTEEGNEDEKSDELLDEDTGEDSTLESLFYPPEKDIDEKDEL